MDVRLINKKTAHSKRPTIVKFKWFQMSKSRLTLLRDGSIISSKERGKLNVSAVRFIAEESGPHFPHPHDPGADGLQRCRHNHDLHVCIEKGKARCP